jgi:NTP pyrophosphatase (non-canonical NTP hydrolase)
MDSKTYQKSALRTESNDFEAIKGRLTGDKELRVLHAGMGLVTESGEFLDAIKKAVFYGKPLDEVNLKEEIGDLLWYCAIAVDALNGDFESIMQTNIDKLKARYPEKFTEERAEERNLELERKILENDKE